MKRHLLSILKEFRNRHVLGYDLTLFCFIPGIALLLRVDGFDQFGTYIAPLAIYTASSIIWKLLVFYPSGLYSRYWRYASVDELSIVILANFFSMIAGALAYFAILRPMGFLSPDLPRSIPFVDGLLTMLFVGGFRFLLRMGYGYKETAAGEPAPGKSKKTLIVGAGVAGSMILRELKMNPSLPIEPVGFLDDDIRKRSARINGVPVVGMLDDLPAQVKKLDVQEVLIAMPTATGKTIRHVLQMCKAAKVPSKTIPGIFEILGGDAKVSQIRDIAIEDLLRRGVVKTDTDGVANLLHGARVMVTGAGGSIGSELCRQILKFSPDEMILLGHGENSIFAIANELRSAVHNRVIPIGQEQLGLHTVIADIRDRQRMGQVFRTYRPSVIFHAAAHKHVGLMEANIADAVSNNVLGTQVLVDLADQFDVDRFVMISSDKAVNPTCVMGVTKRVAELVVLDASIRTRRSFVSVRFGNVLGSRGSVVPIFKQQIAQGGPVLVTHPDARRYFMTIPEAVQLVLQAGTMGEGGEVFVLDMGEPIRIVDLARDLIRLSGLEEKTDIDIEFTGLQRGEKLSEELFFASERAEPSQHEKILVCRHGTDMPQEEREHPHARTGRLTSEEIGVPMVRAEVDQLIAASQAGTTANMRIHLKHIVPEFQDTIAIPASSLLPMGMNQQLGVSMVDEIAKT